MGPCGQLVSLAIEVMQETGGIKVEDVTWLQKSDDYSINVAVLKRVNLAMKWGLYSIKIWTNSATMLDCVGSVITNTKKVQTKEATEMLEKYYLEVLG